MSSQRCPPGCFRGQRIPVCCLQNILYTRIDVRFSWLTSTSSVRVLGWPVAPNVLQQRPRATRASRPGIRDLLCRKCHLGRGDHVVV